MCSLKLWTRHPGRFHRGSRSVEQDTSNGSCNHLENPTDFANDWESPGNPFGHKTRAFPLCLSRGKVVITGNRLHLHLSTVPFKLWDSCAWKRNFFCVAVDLDPDCLLDSGTCFVWIKYLMDRYIKKTYDHIKLMHVKNKTFKPKNKLSRKVVHSDGNIHSPINSGPMGTCMEQTPFLRANSVASLVSCSVFLSRGFRLARTVGVVLFPPLVASKCRRKSASTMKLRLQL